MRLSSIIIMFMYSILCGSILSQLSPSTYWLYATQSSLFSTSATATAVSQYQNVTHEGDILVNGSETFTIQNIEFHMLGKITVTDTSILMIRDAKFVTNPTPHVESIILEGHANLVIINSTVIFQHLSGLPCKIITYDNAKGNITLSTIQKDGDFIAYGNSSIYIRNSTFTGGVKPHINYCGTATFDGATAEIENSNIEGVMVWDNSNTSILNSVVVGLLRTGIRESDQTTVNITGCEINTIQSYGGSPILHIQASTITSELFFNSNASAWLTDCSIHKITVKTNASVFLIDSSADSIRTYDEATVLVGWNLPIFGLVMMHHTLVPIVQTLIIIIPIAVVVIAMVFLFKKIKHQGQNIKVIDR